MTAGGSRSQELIAAAEAVEGPAVSRQPTIAWESASGTEVRDVDGRSYLDFTSSVLVANVGHGHPRVVAAIREQAGQLMHSYNFVNEWRVELGRRLADAGRPHGLDRVWIATTGAEVVEIALKVARWATGRHGTLALDGGYHGKTIAATAVGGRKSSLEGLGPLLPGVHHLPFAREGDEASEREALSQLEALDPAPFGAVIVEIFQGNAGQRMTSAAFLRALARWASENGVVLIADEVQSAWGRTGRLFAFEHAGIEPDVVAAGKGISSSLPLTVMLAKSEVLDRVPRGSLSSTHGGNPMSCRAACEVLDVLEEEKLLENAAEVGAFLLSELRAAVDASPVHAEVRGIGLMIGIEVMHPDGSPYPELARAIVDAAVERGLLVLAPIGLHKSVVRISPPLVIGQEDARRGAEIFRAALAAAG